MANNDKVQLKVIIIGAGLSGVMTGILLHRAGIHFDIFERSQEIKPIGSTMAFNANILPVFEQLGILEEALKISKPSNGLVFYDGDLNAMGSIDLTTYKEKTGYDMILFARPDMYRLLLAQLPEGRLHLNKRIVSSQQDPETGVVIRCSDATEYRGDILVGADGAYSKVRQSMFEEMRKKGLLPESDEEELNVGHVCMVGTTKSFEDGQYADAFKEDYSRFERIIQQGTPHSWSTATVPGNRVCWLMTSQLDNSTTALSVEAKITAAQTGAFKNIEWGPEANEALIKEVRDFPCTLGGTMGDLIDATPMISRVFLEEKLFESWYYGRTVLIGDGGINALQDAVVLVNCIVEITSLTPGSVAAAFEDYREQRFPLIKYQMEKAQLLATLQYGQTLKERAIRYAIFNWIPKSIQTHLYLKDASYRPTSNFLKPIENRGTLPVLPQKSPKTDPSDN
ncbi:hypothetical protein BGZ99_009418 [Dissophora globulifera]|uniref:FAD-binding domain-containing protein n=1 Tax=Dissophora globulifera TaxID=979702 RepID=A0A9P6RYB1_9FUNG|nr:hypothetical protein BGZ99_009418 [Dissophora globulifera]